MKNSYFIIPFINFSIAVLLGLLLRAVYVFPIEGVNFLNVMHAHSHIAMLGWLYMVLYLFLVRVYGQEDDIGYYKKLFWVTQIAVMGMLCTFPFQGYAVGSIIFSTLHIFCSYAFVLRLWKRNNTKVISDSWMLKSGLFMMALSTLGVWVLGPAVGMLGKTSAFYKIAIQFFLHFQFNGWFLVAVLGLFFYTVFVNKELKHFKRFYYLLLLSIILSFSLPLNWYVDWNGLYFGTAVGMVVQVLAFGILIRSNVTVLKKLWKEQSKCEKGVLGFVFFSLVLRLGMQLTTLDPSLATQGHAIRSWTVGFIHLNMLGIITGLLLWLLIKHRIFYLNKLATFGLLVFVLFYLITELLLFVEGSLLFLEIGSIKNNYVYLFWGSVALCLGLFSMFAAFVKPKKYTNE